MSARTLLNNTARALRPSFTPTIARRTLTQSPRALLKESASSDPSSQDYDHHKQDSLAKQKEGKGHWKSELASVSEESVKADRSGPRDTSAEAMKRLQEQTKHQAEQTTKNKTSMGTASEHVSVIAFSMIVRTGLHDNKAL
ncbi:hypothetical protein N0V88_000199 [Collariella sp. IMI 366227]|nr:hypothetical protein N0V88_000199 [Collariella sp. IMI 366227]